MSLNNQEPSQEEQEEAALFNTLFPTTAETKLEEALANPVRESKKSFKSLSFIAKVRFLFNFAKNYIRQEYTRYQVRRSLSK